MVKEICSFDSGMTSANSVLFDRSGQYVYVASDDSTIKVFNTNTGEKDGELKGHEDAVTNMIWDNNKEGFLITAGADCSFRLW